MQRGHQQEVWSMPVRLDSGAQLHPTTAVLRSIQELHQLDQLRCDGHEPHLQLGRLHARTAGHL